MARETKKSKRKKTENTMPHEPSEHTPKWKYIPSQFSN